MILDNKTLTILSNFNQINPSIQFKQGNLLKTVSPTKSIFAKAKVPDEFPNDFCIYDLRRFMSTLSLFEKPEIEFGSKQLTIKQGNTKINYTLAALETIITPPDGELKLPDPAVSFVLTNSTMSQIQKAAGVLSLNELAIVGKNDKMIIEAIDAEGRISDNFKIEIGETDKEFKVIFALDNFKIIPADYNVTIHKVGKSIVAKLVATNMPDDLEYLIAVDSRSEL